MAQSLSDAFTIGGLTRGGGDGTVLVAMRGRLINIDTGHESTYKVDGDGVVTVLAGSTATVNDIDLDFGAGLIETDFIDVDGTGTTSIEGAGLTLSVTFGEELIRALDEGGLQIIGAFANVGWSIGDAGQRIYTHGIAPPDNSAPAPVGLRSIDGNNVRLAIGVPYEPEGGTQIAFNEYAMINFDIIAIAKRLKI
jgi:hypothetical protein